MQFLPRCFGILRARRIIAARNSAGRPVRGARSASDKPADDTGKQPLATPCGVFRRRGAKTEDRARERLMQKRHCARRWDAGHGDLGKGRWANSLLSNPQGAARAGPLLRPATARSLFSLGFGRNAQMSKSSSNKPVRDENPRRILWQSGPKVSLAGLPASPAAMASRPSEASGDGRGTCRQATSRCAWLAFRKAIPRRKTIPRRLRRGGKRRLASLLPAAGGRLWCA